MQTITEFDFKILDFIREKFSCGFLDAVMPVITLFGSAGLIWITMAAALIFFRKYRRDGVMLLIGISICAILGNLLLKNIVARSRPCHINETINMLIAIPKDYSFPSGHTSTSVAAAVILFHADKRLGIPAVVVAVLIAFSRLYLYVHFPSDVLAGAVIGCVIGLAVCVVGERLKSSKNQ